MGLNNNVDLRPGRPINTGLFKDILRYIKTVIRFGEGFNVTTQGNQIVVSLAKNFRGTTGGGSTFIKRVPQLPELVTITNTHKKYQVLWLSEATGILEGWDGSDVDHPLATGDDQIWSLISPQVLWYPETIVTDRIGEPGA